MSTDIAVHSPAAEMSVGERQQYASVLADANMIPKAFQKNPANIFVAIEYGNALGIAPIVALNEINVINGTPSLSASMMASLARSAGHRVRTRNEDDGSAVCEIIRADDPEFTHTSVWDQKKAQGAGLWGKGHWAKDPATMLRWRAISECVRMACPEVLGGLKYTVEEVIEFTSTGPSSSGPAPKATTTRKQKAEPETVSAPMPAPSNRDWLAELDQCATAQDIRNLWKACADAGELTDDLKSAFTSAGTALTAAQNQPQNETEVVDGVLIDEQGEIHEEGAA
ncbi:hypothetical protein PGC08_14270 [Brevibacterium sp. BDJS002]|uniref:hypothetical protein n=1 Tax=Brevibacterium sp. BDJS002 TaxID=3020906 RepID=UPI002307CD82|nr:hypothetical protein [Brevibacterium sp. BDJS002]WCE39155.1 hypothetical protein PGC08_14270 [Brevibacterium sp. BDJS002]